MVQPEMIGNPFKRQLDEKARQLILRERLIVVLITVLAAAIGLAIYLTHNLTVHVQPGLNAVTTVRRGEVPIVNVYSFAERLLQELYRWPENGADDYALRIAGLAAYLTPRCQEWLKRDLDYRSRSGELRGRIRGVQPAELADPAKQVMTKAPGHWVVQLLFILEETSRGLALKQGTFEWRVPVVHHDVDLAANPYGLALDCPFVNNTPKRQEAITDG